MGDTIVAYRIKRDEHSGWVHAGVTPQEVADALRNDLYGDEGLPLDERESLTIEPYETTQAEIDALPEFGGW